MAAGLTPPTAKITQEASRQMLIGKLMMDGRLAVCQAAFKQAEYEDKLAAIGQQVADVASLTRWPQNEPRVHAK